MQSLHGFLHGFKWIMFHGHLDYFQKQPLGGKLNIKPEHHGTPNAHNRCIILFYHVWEPAWIEIHWNSIRLRARLHMTSYYTWGPVTTLHDFGGALGRPLDTFIWALAITWSQHLARVWSGPLSGLLHTWAKSRDHKIVGAQKKVSKARPKTPSKIM